MNLRAALLDIHTSTGCTICCISWQLLKVSMHAQGGYIQRSQQVKDLRVALFDVYTFVLIAW